MGIDIDINKAKTLYESGMSLDQVAKTLGLTNAGSIAYRFKKYGIPIRSNKINSRKYEVNHEFFSSIDTEEKAYWVGFLQTDGYLLTNDFSIGIALAEKDAEHLEKFKTSVGATYPIKTYRGTGYSNKDYCRIIIKSEQMWKDLVKIGVTPQKTKTTLPLDLGLLQNHYVRGLMDGDGSIKISRQSKSGYRGDFVSANKPMSDYISSVFNCSTRLDANKNVWYSEFTLTLENLDYLYGNETFYLQRKYDRAIRARQRLQASA